MRNDVCVSSQQLQLFKVKLKSWVKKKKNHPHNNNKKTSADKISGWEREKYDLLIPC